MDPVTLLVLDDPAGRHLRLLEQLPDSTTIVAGNTSEAFVSAAADADVVLAGLGAGSLLREVWAMAPRVRWVHSFSAGVEGVLFPALIESRVPLTNGRGAFSRPLGEFAITAVLYFAKDLRRMIRSQEAGLWDQFDVEEVYGKVLGIVGYGDIGRAVAERARVFGMKVAALRRRPDLSRADRGLDHVFAPAQKEEMLALSDYVVVAAPLTPETRGLIGERELRSMKATAVIINIGRGPVIVEMALLQALEEGWIRGAALDVFDREPLETGHRFYKLNNVLLSPHTADHTPGWQDLGMHLFLRNFQHFLKGEPLENIVDKRQGY